MATETPNLKLVKPDQGDYYQINVVNANSDKIDTAYNVLNNTVKDLGKTYIKQNHIGNITIKDINESCVLSLSHAGLKFYKGGLINESNVAVSFNNTGAAFNYPVNVQGKDLLTEFNNRYTKTEVDDKLKTVYTKGEVDAIILRMLPLYGQGAPIEPPAFPGQIYIEIL
ncbi:hypothetical protein [Culicoidibacter larvae]|uniref:Uncharacterized protein n=1 Tax=Culicoidibacter larvae TaxID=2579976 RepID=A0A5R8Q7F4_9FIRM|nr:hypothetical protein [Culicoidibacter larvae]TLG71364.1 hypothetical protein FEZ08_10745 [Culicoidibacter larvae]